MNDEVRSENSGTEETTVIENSGDESKSGGGFCQFVAAICAAGAAGAYLYKTRDKRKAKKEARMIKKIEAAGYEVSRIEMYTDGSADTAEEED